MLMRFNMNFLTVGLHHIPVITSNTKNKPGSNKQRYYAEKKTHKRIIFISKYNNSLHCGNKKHNQEDVD